MKRSLLHRHFAAIFMAIVVSAIVAAGWSGQKRPVTLASHSNASVHRKKNGKSPGVRAKAALGTRKAAHPSPIGHIYLASAGAITVTATYDSLALDPTTSDTTADGAVTLRSAIQYTNAFAGSDTIIVPAGTYYLTQPGTGEDAAATGDLDINDSLVIIGAGEGQTIIDGNGSDRVFDIGPLNANIAIKITGLTIVNGYANSESGGGVQIYGGIVELDSVDIVNNIAGSSGGGLEVLDGTFTMNYGSLSLNLAGQNGGGADINAGSSTFNSVVIDSNVAAAGGGIQNKSSGANIWVNNCTFIGDSTKAGGGSYGGAFDNDAGNFTVDHCIFKHNYGDGDGGAFDIDGGVNVISNSVIDSNYSPGSAGGIWAGGTSLSMLNDTVGWNSTNGSQGGIYVGNPFTMQGGAIIFNTSGVYGGGIYFQTSPDTLSNVTIYGNNAATSGGGVYSVASPVYFSNVRVDSNSTAVVGGGIDDESGGLMWVGGSLSNNIASGSGGGLYFNGTSGDDTLSTLTIAGNSPDSIATNIDLSFHVVLIDVTLPVEVTSFLATSDVGSVTLTWNTKTEVNNVGFNVFRKEVGSSPFTLISGFSSNTELRGLGTSSTGRTYSFTDNSVASGATYSYKIQSVSSNGAVKDWNTVTVTAGVPKDYALYQNYPNPFNPSTTIRFDLKQASTVTLEIYNILGQRVYEENRGMLNAGRYNESIDMSRYASGVYFYKIAASGNNGEKFVELKRLMLLK